MAEAGDSHELPEKPEAANGPAIGTDDWVARAEERIERYSGLAGATRRVWNRSPPSARLAVVVGPVAVFPLLTDSDYFVRVGVNALLFALLALGLNVVVGYAGLLDLGYVAFYGFGAYSYAILSSDHFNFHWPTEATIPLVIVASALLGLLLGLPSRRLLGDYLAIVTLFFGQIFVTVVTNADRITLPGRDEPTNFTGGPNGIAGVDPMRLLGIDFITIQDYFYLSLVVFMLVISGLHFLNESRTGRAWRALREDPLAAELMGMPVKRLKLLAFAFGAAAAGLTGTIFAAVQIGVFPQNFDLPLLITLYAMVILGGVGSLAGMVIGAAVITIVLEVLRSPDDARLIFYAMILLVLVAALRPWWRAAAVLAGTLAFGFIVHAIVGSVWSRATEGEVVEAGGLADAIEAWVLLPADPKLIGNFTFVGLVAAAIALTRLRGLVRTLAIAPVLYLAAFVWENRLVTEPSVTRFLLVGALLIVLMQARPEGLLGTKRVEIG